MECNDSFVAESQKIKFLYSKKITGTTESTPTVTTGTLCWLRWWLSSDVDTPRFTPDLRVRVNATSEWQADTIWALSLNSAGWSPGPEPRPYDLFLIPPDPPDTLYLSFDLINFESENIATGTLRLEEISANAIPLTDFGRASRKDCIEL